ncbi:MAG: glycosyltransferase family 39 protein, partial [Bacteroidia bacterium]|nr:glycosyltransferase family 39 protein [Bacteroidia bacterium]
NMDDNLVTQKHVLTSKGLSSINKIFSQSYYSNNVDLGFGYRPIVLLSFAMEHQFLGESAKTSHFVNLILYAIAVLLLFKLLLGYTGEKGILLAFLATLLFAVHPIHTEVVASIKNRDEILAFLFLMLSALSIEKYLKNNSILSLLSILIFFSIGMLAKKSIFTMIFVLPLVVIILNKISLKKIFLITLMLALPAAIIGSSFNWFRFSLIFISPFVLVVFVYYIINFIKYKSQTFNVLNKLLNFIQNIYFLKILSIIFFGLAIWEKEYLYFIIAIPFSLLAIRKNEPIGIMLLLVQLIVFSYFFLIEDFAILAIYSSVFYLAYSLMNRKLHWILWLNLPVLALNFFNSNFHALSVLGLLVFLLFCFLIFKNIKWGLLYLITTFFVSYLFFNIGLFQIVLASFFIIYLINSKWPSLNTFKIAPIILLISMVIFNALSPNCKTHLWNKTYSAQNINIVPLAENAIQNIPQENNSILKEGRNLAYFENTLVAKHTIDETIGTGMETLLVYFQTLAFPVELSFYYGYSKTQTVNLLNPFVLISILIHLALVFIAIWQFKKNPFISIGIAWYIISILLFSNWVELVAGMVGERLAFTASAGFCLFVAALFVWAKPTFNLFKPKSIEYLFIVIIVLFSFRTIARNADWENPLTLVNHDMEHLGNSFQAHNLLALYNMNESMSNPKLNDNEKYDLQEQAKEHFKAANQIYPNFLNSHFDLGRVYLLHKDFINAKKELELALSIENDNLFVLEQLVKTCYELNLEFEIEKFANQYLKLYPQNEDVYLRLAYFKLNVNKPQEAMKYCQQGLLYFPASQALINIINQQPIQ